MSSIFEGICEIKASINTDHTVSEVVSMLREKLGLNKIPATTSRRDRQNELNLYIFRVTGNVKHLAFKRLAEVEYPLRQLMPELVMRRNNFNRN